MELNLCSIARQFSDEASAWEAVEEMLWPEGPVCPHCGDTGRAYFLKARSGERTTKAPFSTYKISDSARMDKLMSQASGRRLTYCTLVGR